MTSPATPPTGQFRDASKRRVGAGVVVFGGVIIFSLLVWLAFSLGFQRMRADLRLGAQAALVAAPVVHFEAEAQGWSMVRPGDPKSGAGAEYGNIGVDSGATCVFTWAVDRADFADAASDSAATLALLSDEGHDIADPGTVRIQTINDQSIELVVASGADSRGLETMSAARVFSGSDDYVVFTMMCEPTGDLDQEFMQEVLRDVTLDIDLAN